jgi:heterodisulfide reductase subunit B
MSIDVLPAYALVSRNLALAARQPGNGHQLVAPCSMCYLNLSKTDHYMANSPELARQINASLEAGGLNYTPGSVQVRHLLDIFVNDVGYDRIGEKVKNSLKGLRVAPYYGCVIVRPGYGGGFDDPEYPTTMDQLLKTLGAEVVDFPLKSHCCGGHMTQISESVALELIYRLLKNASDYQADLIVTLCPMCQLNLDAYQDNVNKAFKSDFKLPVLYFTQMIGLAMGIDPVELGIGKEFINARPALAKIGVELPVEEASKKKRPNKEQLPMPRMPEEG